MVRVEILGFSSCPNTPRLKHLAEDAAASIAEPVAVEYVDQERLDPGDIRRGYPAPTILLNGKSYFGDPPPESPAMGCRSFPDGLPTVEELIVFIVTTE